MKPALLVIFIALFITSAHAQNPIDQHSWTVKWVPTSIATPLFPHFRFGVEKRWGKTAINAQAGVTIPKRYTIDNTIKGRSAGYAYRLEVRRYFIHMPNSLDLDMFWGLEGFYYYAHNIRSEEFTDDLTSKEYHWDDFTYTKSIVGGVIKWGIQFYPTKHFIFEVSGGAGLKVKNLTEQHIDANSLRERPSQDFTKWGLIAENNRVKLALPILLAVGYRF